MDGKKIVVCLMLFVLMMSSISLVVHGQPELTPPRNLNAEGYDGYIDIDWRPPAIGGDRVDGYNIYRSLSSEDQQYFMTVDRYTQSYRDRDVINGRTYYYWVTAIYDVNRETEFSNGVSATPLGASIPTEPRNLKAYPGDSFVELDWNRPLNDGNSPIFEYIIYRGTSSDELVELETIGAVTDYMDNEVTNGITYFYGVKARNDVGDSEMSNIDSATPQEGIDTPEAPRNLKALSGNGFVELYWEPPLDDGGSAIQNYRIERDNGMRRFHNTDGDETFYHDDTVTNGITYVYRVSAVNVAGEGLKSSEVTAHPTSIGIPPGAGDLLAEAGLAGVSLTWSALETDINITSYNVYRGPNENRLRFIGETVNTEFSDTGVETGTTYYYMVRAVTEDHKLGLKSNIDTATVIEMESPPDEDEENGVSFLFLGIIGLVIALMVIVIVLVILLKNKDKPKQPYQQPPQTPKQPEVEQEYDMDW